MFYSTPESPATGRTVLGKGARQSQSSGAHVTTLVAVHTIQQSLIAVYNSR